ncbi:MAG TPA: imidazole glycerol phosphate synthase subunit HisF [Virgibacillus sp.]|nr:imidazole glycerol phosphate synthase subunit HisF [Virgibacillus sp.]
MSKNNRIIPCLDVDGGRVVKGKRFKDIQDVADPLVLAKKYSAAGADELVFYDITASAENRGLFMKTIKEIADEIDIPFTVGGGIRTVEDIQRLFDRGVDKVSINSAAIHNPDLIKEAADIFGAERIVLSMDVKENSDQTWSVFERGGQQDTGIDAIQWAINGEKLGAGEIVVNSIDGDGDKSGYRLDLIKAIVDAVHIPVVASGGAGKMEHFHAVLTEGKAAAALAASVFHYNEIDVATLRSYLENQNK